MRYLQNRTACCTTRYERERGGGKREGESERKREREGRKEREGQRE